MTKEEFMNVINQLNINSLKRNIYLYNNLLIYYSNEKAVICGNINNNIVNFMYTKYDKFKNTTIYGDDYSTYILLSKNSTKEKTESYRNLKKILLNIDSNRRCVDCITTTDKEEFINILNIINKLDEKKAIQK